MDQGRTRHSGDSMSGLVTLMPSYRLRSRKPCQRSDFGHPGRRRYAVGMTDSPLSPQEIRAAAAAHHELGPEYSDAVVASFLERIDEGITARTNARLASMRQPEPPAEPGDRRTLLKGSRSASGSAALPLSWSVAMPMNVCIAFSGYCLSWRWYARSARAGRDSNCEAARPSGAPSPSPATILT